MENSIATRKSTSQIKKLKTLIEKSLDDGKAIDIVTVDLAGKSSLGDYMIIASGTSQRHITTLADHIVDKLENNGLGGIPIEGRDSSDWVVVDAGNIIVHLFHPEARKHYNLEKMWSMALPPIEAAL
jgi:ribosome-associated protein